MATTADSPTTTRDPEYTLKLAVAAAVAAEENRGQEVTVLDMREQTAIFDFFVIATGTSQRQLRAMGDAIDDVLQKEHDHKRVGTEGYQDTQWVLLDYGSVVIHLFDEQHRGFYRLEDLWAGAKRVDYKAMAKK